MTTEQNPLLQWLGSLTIVEHKKAVKYIITRFEINRSTLYAWKRPEKQFTTIEREELNKIAQAVNNTQIFEL